MAYYTVLLLLLASGLFGFASAEEKNAESATSPEINNGKVDEYAQMKFSSASDQLVLKNYVLRRNGDYQGAEKTLEEALKIAKTDSDKIKVFNALGGLYMQSGKSIESERYLREAVNLAEKTLNSDSLQLASYLDNLSVSCGENRKFSEAEGFNSRATQIYMKYKDDPRVVLDLIKVLDNRGGILCREEKYAEAENAYLEAIKLGKDFKQTPPELLACVEDNLGGVYAKQGQLAKAEESKVNALSLLESCLGFTHPDTIKAKKNLAYVYARQGKLKEASDLLKSAIEKLKGSGSINKLLLESCIEDLSNVQAMMIDEKNGPVPKRKLSAKEAELVQAFEAIKAGKLDEAKETFEKVIAADPKEAGAYAGRAVVFRMRKDTENELKDLSRAIEFYDCAQYRFARAQVYLEKRDHKDAINDLKRCTELDKGGKMKEAEFLLGASYVEINKPESGLPYLNSYLSDVKGNAQAYASRAAAYIMLGKKDLAAKDVKLAKELGYN